MSRLSFTRRRIRVGRSEHGAAAVEGALIAPVFFALLFGTIETAMMYVNRTSVSDGASAASRAAAVAGNDPDADYVALKTVVSKLPSDGTGLRYVIVFNSPNQLNRFPHADCIKAAEAGGDGVDGLCNVYQRNVALNPNSSLFGYDTGDAPLKTADKHWPARSRVVSFSAVRSVVGVYVSTNYKGISGFLPTNTWTFSAVSQVEGKNV